MAEVVGDGQNPTKPKKSHKSKSIRVRASANYRSQDLTVETQHDDRHVEPALEKDKDGPRPIEVEHKRWENPFSHGPHGNDKCIIKTGHSSKSGLARIGAVWHKESTYTPELEDPTGRPKNLFHLECGKVSHENDELSFQVSVWKPHTKGDAFISKKDSKEVAFDVRWKGTEMTITNNEIKYLGRKLEKPTKKVAKKVLQTGALGGGATAASGAEGAAAVGATAGAAETGAAAGAGTGLFFGEGALASLATVLDLFVWPVTILTLAILIFVMVHKKRTTGSFFGARAAQRWKHGTSRRQRIGRRLGGQSRRSKTKGRAGKISGPKDHVAASQPESPPPAYTPPPKAAAAA